ncbi:MAG: hypothetical protein AAGG48_31530 [Planctomycetota bacterium]
MLKSCVCVLAMCVFTGIHSQRAQAAQPQEVWLKAIEGTWTWRDDERGDVTVTFTSHAEGKGMVGVGKDDNGSFVSIIGWEPWDNVLTDTGFHSSGSGGRIVYNEVTDTTLKGTRKGTDADGNKQPDLQFDVVRKGNKVTVTTTNDKRVTKTSVLTKAAKN